MKGNFRRSMIWLHTYSSLVLGWLLFAVFFTGTLSYFTPEITHWMRPEIAGNTASENIVSRSFDKFHTMAPEDATRWQIRMPTPRDNRFELSWKQPGQSRRQSTRLTLDPNTFSPITIRDSDGGFFFREFHYSLSLRDFGGRYITGIAAMLMLIGIFTGIFTHRRFFRDFFTLRFKQLAKGLTDVHALIGIITLPFCFVLSFSALVFYIYLYMPWSANSLYEDGYQELNNNISTSAPRLTPSHIAVTPIRDITPFVNQVKTLWPQDNAIAYVTYDQPNDSNSQLLFWRNKQVSVSGKSEVVVFSAANNWQMTELPPESVVRQIRRVFIGLHEAKFADTSLRWILFILGLASSALIATGLIIWLNQRIKKAKPHRGHLLVARLNVSGIGGLILATVVFFYANRLISSSHIERAELEVMSFFIAWLVILVGSFVLNPSTMWHYLLRVISAGLLALPIVDYALAPQWLETAIAQRNMLYIGFDITLVVSGLITALIASYLTKRAKSQTHTMHQNNEAQHAY